jgi:hypothetical protein
MVEPKICISIHLRHGVRGGADGRLYCPGGCWGSWPSEASPTSGQADDFSSRAASISRRDFRGMGLTETLILLMLREDCCAGMVLHGGASLRCRRHG